MFLYSCPGFLGIPPHRHQRVSRVETSFDGIVTCLWIIATTQLAIYGYCPNQKAEIISNMIVYLDISSKYCPTLQATLILGGIAILLYLWRFIDGIRDQFSRQETERLGKHIMFARGSWKD